MHTLDSRCFSALSQTFSCSLFLFELVLLVGKYGIWTSEALAIVERHHPNSLHASCVHNTTLIALRYSGNACSSAVSLKPAVYLLFCSPLCLLLRFFLHSRKACTASSGPPNLRQRHWPSGTALGGKTSPHTAAPPWHREAQLLLLAVFPTLVPGFPKWGVDAHILWVF